MSGKRSRENKLRYYRRRPALLRFCGTNTARRGKLACKHICTAILLRQDTLTYDWGNEQCKLIEQFLMFNQLRVLCDI